MPYHDRKSTRLNSSHTIISYAVFCLKKKQTTPRTDGQTARTPRTRAAPRRVGRGGVCVVACPSACAPAGLPDSPLWFFFLNDRAPPEFSPLPPPALLPI